MPRQATDMTGKRVGRLTVVRRVGSSDKQALWLCRCDCGAEKVISGGTLRQGKTKSCGCVYRATRTEIARKSIAKEKHGDSFKRLYFVWNDMKARCYNPNDVSYKNYGGRGIVVCDEWRTDYAAFKEWAYKTGYDENAKRGECTLDRIDKDGNYSPDNCRWAGMKLQSNNRRNTPMITINGRCAPITEWAAEAGLPRGLLYARLRRGWSGEELISPPDQHRRRLCESRSTPEYQRKNKRQTD